MTKLRPLHTTAISLWIYGAAVAVIYHWLSRRGDGLTRGDHRRFWLHTACWLAAGIGIVATLAAGVTSGREYVGFHPAFSVLLLGGWLVFAWTFLKRLRLGFWGQPVYVWFWTVGVLYFVYTFVEWHAYLLPGVHEYPIRDLQLQWKACGTLVGSFNFLVYGSLIYVAERVTKDERYGQSGIAFLLFGVGCLNSFTNYAHHTYHLPQSHLVKWIAFIVSMIEIVILLRILYDIGRSLRAQAAGSAPHPAGRFMVSAKWWTAIMLFVAIGISVPSWNSLIHGTHVVTGHAIGTMLGIDTMALFAGLTYLLAEVHARSPARLEVLGGAGTRRGLLALNVGAAGLITWLLVSGTAHGASRYVGEAAPEWVNLRWILFPILGVTVAVSLLFLVFRWLPLLLTAEPIRGAAAAPSPVVEPPLVKAAADDGAAGPRG